jgi:CRP-like cAMP-binding protein
MQYLRSRSCVPGEVVVRKGDRADAMYLIASGEVEVVLPDENVKLGPGDFFGEMAVVNRRRRIATVRALSPCRLLVLDAEDFHDLMESHPALKRHVHEIVRSRQGEGEV